ncbi:response regulator [Sphingomonas sp. 3-13AW]|uniref:response regulator n=1 Tax=Sphingomonas sp. 3-13AW TaxID=3050450 RepID=UPI003BB72717
MIDDCLRNRRILVAEDEYLIADDLRDALTAAGAEVLGPFPTVTDAIAFVDAGTAIDAAVLDINLRGDMIFPVADALRARGVPFVFATGYDEWSLPERFSGATRLEKPVSAHRVTAAIRPLFEGSVVDGPGAPNGTAGSA